jgi:haloalkane dehalogenase
MDILRTPDERFANLPGHPFAPHYVEVEGLRMHFVDEGPRVAPVVLMLHGEPSWSYLYRKLVPVLVAANLRAVAPDLVGFGRSDKATRREEYTYQRHVDWLRAYVKATSLRNITLVCQDWGGLLGLRLVAEHPDWFARVVVANTFLPTGETPLGPAFDAWCKYSQETPRFHVGGILKGGCAMPLAPEVMAAYDAPFPDDRYLAGARQFPVLVPNSPDDPAAKPNRAAWAELERFEKPFLTAFSDLDPITRGADAVFQARVPGAKDQPHTTIRGGGHFLQEDRGEDLAHAIVAFVRRTGD